MLRALLNFSKKSGWVPSAVLLALGFIQTLVRNGGWMMHELFVVACKKDILARLHRFESGNLICVHFMEGSLCFRPKKLFTAFIFSRAAALRPIQVSSVGEPRVQCIAQEPL